MPTAKKTLPRVTGLATTATLRFMTGQAVPPNSSYGMPPRKVGGYRYINIFVEFDQTAPDELPVDLGVLFAFDADGTMATRCYVNLEQNVGDPQPTNFVQVSGGGRAWHGIPNVTRYVARLPVMGPYVQVFADNLSKVEHTVTIWGYLVS